jgi:hypothetical protein
MMEGHQAMNHAQIGDPARLGVLLVTLSEMAEPPVRIAAGSDGAEAVTAKGKLLRDEGEKWRHLSVSTDGEAPAKGSSPRASA